MPQQHADSIDLTLRELDLPQLSEEDQLQLQAPFTLVEIECAMMDIDEDKSPDRMDILQLSSGNSGRL